MATSAPAGDDEAPNRRSQLKSDRRSQLLAAAERLFAERGFLAVRLEDIGAAAGVSGPAIYRHFPNKESLLVELLVGISTRLLTGARDVTSRHPIRLRRWMASSTFTSTLPWANPISSGSRTAIWHICPRPPSAKSAGRSGNTSKSGWACCVSSTRGWLRPMRG
ncbi:bacterial regulatory s, tetR family protein [Mycobacterium xenopi 4042]|uniref:Bacterial regulatory s, tetR family protein n=1 Tax=Mycobacterium xenopi 4042 TaxID=1299334 RepID=X8AQL4_MYCXE|nr:bacterial regulatory s, tetR family protein [Mycobacterium xenopi 4042]